MSFLLWDYYSGKSLRRRIYLGAPQLPRITIELGNNKRFVVETVNYSLENIHVRKIELNGKELTGNSISHKDIMEGGI